MENIFKSAGIELSQEQLNKFVRYKELLLEYNEKFNITAITDEEEIVKKHFIDSLMGCEFFDGKTYIDIGSGGGFPAIPIKIFMPNLEVTLLEATEKKCNFLNIVIKELNLENIKVLNGRAEELAKKDGLRESFDLCSARAVARLNTLCEYCIPFVKKGGKFISFKGDAEEEIAECDNAFKVLGGSLKTVKKFDFYGAKRTVVVIDKIKNTPPAYPRGRGKERKNPL